MSLTLPVFLRLAVTFAPSVAPETLAAFAQAESRLNPYAIYDNATGESLRPDSRSQAIALATSLLAKQHSLDLGIMQVNSGNLSWVGLTVATAFDPSQSIRAGAVILVEAYQRCRRGGAVAEQPALRCTASVYNTGKEQAGILNGYQARVWRTAAQIVPAIQSAGEADASPGNAPDDVVASRPRSASASIAPNAQQPAPAGMSASSAAPTPVRVLSAPARPPAWDVYASAAKSGAKQ